MLVSGQPAYVATFDPSVLGVFIFGLVAGICPCNSVLCLGLIGYLTSQKTDLSFPGILKPTAAFSFGTILVHLSLGAVAGYLLFLDETAAWAAGGVLMILTGLQLLHMYKPPIRSIFNRFRAPISSSVWGRSSSGSRSGRSPWAAGHRCCSSS